MLDTTHRTRTAAAADTLVVPLVRANGLAVVLLLALAYFTGEEFQHTHAFLGYGIAAVVVVAIYWELVRPHELRSAKLVPAILAAERAFRTPGISFGGPAIVACGLMLLVDVLGIVALLMLWATHTLWPAAAVDEAHEAVAYLTLGLAVFFVALVIVVSSPHLERRLAGILRRKT